MKKALWNPSKEVTHIFKDNRRLDIFLPSLDTKVTACDVTLTAPFGSTDHG